VCAKNRSQCGTKESALQLLIESRIARFLTAWLLAVALVSSPVHAADAGGDTIRANANEVRIAFAATDRDGHSIKSLRSSDVAVADNGLIIRRFRSFRPAMESPLDVVLLLDASGSLASQLTEEIAEAKSFLANSAWDERDRVSILAFAGLQTQLLCVQNCRAAGALEKLNALRADSLTPLYDALVKAAEVLKENRDPGTRPAMIVFTDGMDTISMSSMWDAVHEAEELQAPIYAVNTRPRKSPPGRGDATLEFLAANTGGLSFGPEQNSEKALSLVLDDLRSGYVLTYEPPEQRSGQHDVRLLPTSDPGLQFRSRRGYDEPSNE
jgi:VWFA-related protein